MRTVPLVVAGLLAAAAATAALAWRAGTSAGDDARARLRADTGARLDADGVQAAGRLRAAVAASQERGDVRAAGFPVEARDVPWVQPAPGDDDPDLLRATALEHGGDAARAEAAYRDVAEHGLSGDSRAAALRALARLRSAAGDDRGAETLLHRAREFAPAGSRTALLVEAALARDDEDERSHLRAALSRGEYPETDPFDRAQIHAGLGGDAPDVAHLAAARALADSPDAHAVVSVPGGRLAWRVPGATGVRRVALAREADVLAAVHPSFGAGMAALDAGGRELPPPFPPLRIAPSEIASVRIDTSAAVATLPWRIGGLAVAAALAAAAVLHVRHERARALLDRRRENFVCAVTHELKTPVANVLLYAETLERHGADDPAQVPRFARVVASEALRLQARVQELLDVASGRREIGAADGRFDAAAAVRRVTADLADRAQARGVRIVVRTDGAGAARGSEGLAARALHAVVANAIEFGGRGEVRVTAERTGASVRLVVEDDGPGIPVAERERVFEPFVRLGDEMTRSVPGSGLGLALARRCAEECGGTARIEDRTGPGARVVLAFPAAEEA